MVYKMKGPSMYKDRLKVNRNGYRSMSTGQARSSSFQMAEEPNRDIFGRRKKGWKHSAWNPKNWRILRRKRKSLSKRGTEMSEKGK